MHNCKVKTVIARHILGCQSMGENGNVHVTVLDNLFATTMGACKQQC
jgi:hypothetical protein